MKLVRRHLRPVTQSQTNELVRRHLGPVTQLPLAKQEPLMLVGTRPVHQSQPSQEQGNKPKPLKSARDER